MSYLFAILYVVCFIVAVVFLVKTLLGKKKGNDTGKSKIITIVAFVLFVAFFILTGVMAPAPSEGTSNNKTASTENDIKQYEDQTKNELPVQDNSANEVSASEPVSDSDVGVVVQGESSEKEPINETVSADASDDISIITRDGHPTYYGSVEESHKVWDDVEKGKIHFGDKSYGHNDKPILSMSAYRNEDVIRSIDVNFENFNNNPNLDIDEVIPLVASYMPYDIMDKWYVFGRSELIASDDGTKANYYVITYSLTDEGGDAYYSKEHSYSGSIDVIIQVHDDIVQSFNISFGTPRWMSSLKQNKYHTEEWLCNLYDFR